MKYDYIDELNDLLYILDITENNIDDVLNILKIRKIVNNDSNKDIINKYFC